MSDAPCEIHEAVDALTLAQDLARCVADALRLGLAQRGQALLVVSGGSTPVPFFDALAQTALDWPNVSITLADERWVPPDHADSNERLVRAHLLQGLAAQARFVPLKNKESSAARGLPGIEAAVAALPWPADAVVLGMGGDAHTASLFPRATELARALDDTRPERCLAVGVPAPPNVPVARISLSRRALLDTGLLAVHVTGRLKWFVLEQAMDEGPVEDMPVRLALRQSKVPCRVFYAD
jgi:6-phosphogluconolactonase